MNKVFKRVFNKSLGMYVVASENAKGNGKSGSLKTIVGAITLASLITGSISASAEQVYTGYDLSQGSSFLENSNFSYGSWQNNNYTNQNFWENQSEMKGVWDTVNVSDFNYAPPYGDSYFWGNYSTLNGNKNTILSGANNYNSNYYAYTNTHGNNNTVQTTLESYLEINGNNNTYIGSHGGSYAGSSASNSLVSKFMQYGELTDEQFDLLFSNKTEEFANSLLEQGYSYDELNKMGIYQGWDDYDNLTWYADSNLVREVIFADVKLKGLNGYANNAYGANINANGNQNNLIGDDTFASGENNIVTGKGSAVLDGSNNVITGTTTSLNKGSNNIIVAAKNAERSKYTVNSNGDREAERTSEKNISESISVYEKTAYTGNFASDYERLVNFYFISQDSSESYSNELYAVFDFETFMAQRNNLFKHYGYSVGEANNSILIGSDGLFTAEDSIAIGHNTATLGKNSIALGANSATIEDNTIAAGFKKLTSVQDGADDMDLVNVRQVRAWSDNMIAGLANHQEFTDNLQVNGSLYGNIKDITPEEVMEVVQGHVTAGTNTVHSDLEFNVLPSEVKRAKTEILAALEIVKDREVAKSENTININALTQSAIGSELSNSISSNSNVLTEITNAIDGKISTASENLTTVIEGGFGTALENGTSALNTLYASAKEQLSSLIDGKFNITDSNNATIDDDIEHSSAINTLINNAFNKEEVVSGLTVEQQEEISQAVQNNANAKHEQITQEFSNFSESKISQLNQTLAQYLVTAKSNATKTFEILNQSQNQAMIDAVGNEANTLDAEWANQAYSHAEKELAKNEKEVTDFTTAQDQEVLKQALEFADAEDLKLTQKGLDALNTKDAELQKNLNDSIKAGDEAVLASAIDLAQQIDLQIQADYTQVAQEQNENLLNILKAKADSGDKVIFDKFDEFLADAEKADEYKIVAQINADDLVLYQDISVAVDAGDMNTLNEGKDYIDQRYGALNDQLNQSEKVINASIASSLASASVPTSGRAGRGMVGFGTGHYGGEMALALGASAMSSSTKWSFGVVTSLDTQKNNSGSFSIGYYW